MENECGFWYLAILCSNLSMKGSKFIILEIIENMTNLFRIYPFLNKQTPIFTFDPDKYAYLPGDIC